MVGSFGSRALFVLCVFSLVSFVILLSHLIPWWLIAFGGLVLIVLPLLIIVGFFDRGIFVYRRWVDDDTVATFIVLWVIFLCSGFIVLFLGTESMLEGLTVARRLSAWVSNELSTNRDDLKGALSGHIDYASDLIRGGLEDMDVEFSETVWWGPVKQAVRFYLQQDGAVAIDDSAGMNSGSSSFNSFNGTINSSIIDSSSDISSSTCGPPGSEGAAGNPFATDSGEGGESSLVAFGMRLPLWDVLTEVRENDLSPWQALQLLKDKVEQLLDTWDMSMEQALAHVRSAISGSKHLASISVGLANVSVGMSLGVLQGFIFAMSLMVSFGFKALLFFTLVWYLLSSKGSLFDHIADDLLGLRHRAKREAVRTLRGSLEAVFFSMPTIACFHGIITLLSFTILGVDFPFFATFASVVFSILPVLSLQSWVSFPWALALCYRGYQELVTGNNVLRGYQDFARGILLFCANQYFSYLVQKRVINSGVSKNEFFSYLVTLLAYLGFNRFGAQGVFAGPLVLVLSTLVYRCLDHMSTESRRTFGQDAVKRYRRGRPLSLGNASHLMPAVPPPPPPPQQQQQQEQEQEGQRERSGGEKEDRGRAYHLALSPPRRLEEDGDDGDVVGEEEQEQEEGEDSVTSLRAQGGGRDSSTVLFTPQAKKRDSDLITATC